MANTLTEEEYYKISERLFMILAAALHEQEIMPLETFANYIEQDAEQQSGAVKEFLMTRVKAFRNFGNDPNSPSLDPSSPKSHLRVVE